MMKYQSPALQYLAVSEKDVIATSELFVLDENAGDNRSFSGFSELE